MGEQARACWGAADCRRYGGRTSGLCSTSGAQPGGGQAADCSRCATRGTLSTRAQCAHSVRPTPSRLNSDGTGRTKVTVAADGTCALICAASGEVQPSDAKKKVRRTVPQHQHAHAGLPPGKLGWTRRRRRRRRSTWAATPSSRARGTGSGRSGKTSGAVDPGCCPRAVACRVGWSSRSVRWQREHTADAFTARSPGCTLATPPGCHAARLGSPRTARAARPARWC
eukprot:COSAG06_NODE_1210_length_10251_cov_8.941588_7_plen_226_part_00